MKTLALVTSKGGSGKSSIAASLAVAAADDGLAVVTIDTDIQGTLAAWGGRRKTENIVHRAAEPEALGDLLHRLRAHGGTGLAIVDTAGIAGTGAIIAARAADLVLVPVRPTLLDLDAAKMTADRLKAAPARFAFVFSQVPTSAPERAREAARAVMRLGTTTAPSYTSSRVAYHDAMSDGLGVTEYDPKGKAAEEIRALWEWVKEQIADAKT